MAAKAILAPFMHPLHWLTAIIVAAVAYFGVLFLYRWQHPRRQRSAPAGRRVAHSSRGTGAGGRAGTGNAVRSAVIVRNDHVGGECH